MEHVTTEAPNKIDWNNFNPEEVLNESYCFEILEYLRGIDRDTIQELQYQKLMDLWGIEESEEDNELTHEEAVSIASDFYLFCRYMFQAFKGFKWVQNHHHKYICDALEKRMYNKASTPNLIINMPPRYSKTEIVSVYYPAFCFGHFNDSEFILASYSGMLAEQNSYRVREIVQSEAFQKIFNVTLDKSAMAKRDFRTEAGGRCYATSVGG